MSKTERRIAEWVALEKQKDSLEPVRGVRGYVARYEIPEIDTERARREAAAAGELAKQFLAED